MIGKRYKEEKKAVGEKTAVGFERIKQLTPQIKQTEIKQVLRNIAENAGNTCPLSRQNKEETADKIAEQSKVSPRTVKNAEKFADAVDKVSENTGINPQKILSGAINASRKDIQNVSRLEPEQQKNEKRKHGRIKGN